MIEWEWAQPKNFEVKKERKNMKKRIFKFILFKVVEVSLAAVYVHGFYLFWNWAGLFDGEDNHIIMEYVVSTTMTSLFIILIFLAGWGLWLLIKKNWEWAE